MPLYQLKETLAKAESYYIDVNSICYHINWDLKRTLDNPESLQQLKESGLFTVDFSEMGVDVDSTFLRKVKTLLSGHFANRLDVVNCLSDNKVIFKITKL